MHSTAAAYGISKIETFTHLYRISHNIDYCQCQCVFLVAFSIFVYVSLLKHKGQARANVKFASFPAEVEDEIVVQSQRINWDCGQRERAS